MRRSGLFLVIFLGMLMLGGCFYQIKKGSQIEEIISDTNDDFKKDVDVRIDECFQKEIADELKKVQKAFRKSISVAKEDRLVSTFGHYTPKKQDTHVGGYYILEADAFVFNVQWIITYSTPAHECMHRIWAKNMTVKERHAFIGDLFESARVNPMLETILEYMLSRIQGDNDYNGQEETELFAQIGAIIINDYFQARPPTFSMDILKHYKKWIKEKFFNEE